MVKPKHQYLELLEEQPTGSEDVPATVSSHVGATLRAAREEFGDSLRQVADSLKIRFVYLQAIEDGRFDDLPGSTYAVGFVRTYADFLGLDGDEIVRRFREETTDMHSRQELVFPEPITEGRTPNWATLVASVVILVTVFGGWYYLTNKDRLDVELVPRLPDSLAKLLRDDGGSPPPSVAAAQTAPAVAGQSEPAAAPAAPAESAPAPAARESALAEPEIEPAPAGDAAEPGPPIVAAAPAPDSPPSTEIPPATTMEEQGSAMSEPEPEEQAPPPATETDVAVIAAPPQDTAGESPTATAEAPEAVAPTVAAAEGPVAVPPQETSAAEPSADATADAVDASAPVPVDAAPATQAIAETEAAVETEPAAETTTETADRLTTGVYSEATNVRANAPDPAPNSGRDVAAAVQRLAAAPPGVAGAADAATGPPEALDDSATGAESAQNEPPPAPPVPDADAAAAEAAETRIAVLNEPVEVTDSTEIVLRARLDSYVQVHDASDNVLHKGVLRAGESYRVPQAPGLSLMTGNAGAIEIFVGGASTPAIGPVGAVRRNVALDPVRLLRGQAVIE